MLVATSTQTISNIVKNEYSPSTRFCRKEIKYNGAAKTFLVGELVNATGGVPATAADIAGFLVDDVVAQANVDAVLPIFYQGAAEIVAENLKLGALAKADVVTELAKRQIKSITPVVFAV